MLRIYTMFPRGRAGFALILLRMSVAIGLLMSALAHVGSRSALAAAGVLALALAIGLATPVCAAICCVVQLALLWWVTGAVATCLVVASFVSVALSMLGPGAYSVDARIFGRRRVVFIDGDPSSNE
jgi:hypothetical protein